MALDATQFQFMPGRVEVNQGDQVVITLTASDVVHGFYLDGYGIERRVEPGVPQQITFVADQAGKFRYRCAVSCGPLHPFMIGELVVTPNAPFWRAAGLILVAVTGMLAYLWQSKGIRYEQTQA
jgi:heme/copper-type cytochrome/quinol oxidase subunit 2